MTSFVSISSPGIASDFESGLRSIECPARYAFAPFASFAILIIPLKKEKKEILFEEERAQEPARDIFEGHYKYR